MKKSIIIFATMLLCTTTMYAQDYKVDGKSIVYTKIIDDTSKSVEEAHAAMEAFFAMHYNDVNSTSKLNQPDHLIYKGLFMNVHLYGMGMWVIDVPHVVDVSIKENRLRVKVTIDQGLCRGTQSLNKYNYNIVEHSPIGNNNKVVSKKDATKAFEETSLRINTLLKDIENSLKSASTEEDW